MFVFGGSIIIGSIMVDDDGNLFVVKKRGKWSKMTKSELGIFNLAENGNSNAKKRWGRLVKKWVDKNG